MYRIGGLVVCIGPRHQQPPHTPLLSKKNVFGASSISSCNNFSSLVLVLTLTSFRLFVRLVKIFSLILFTIFFAFIYFSILDIYLRTSILFCFPKIYFANFSSISEQWIVCVTSKIFLDCPLWIERNTSSTREKFHFLHAVQQHIIPE